MPGKKERMAHAKRNNPAFAVQRYADGDVKRERKGKLKDKAKKVHSTGTDLVIVKDIDRGTERKIKKYDALAETVKSVGSTFGIRKREIMDAVAAGNIDHAVMHFTRQAYSTVVALIPIAEKAYKKHQREHQAYVLNALISQGRELAADLIATDDRKRLGETLVREILEPAFKNILQAQMQEQMQLKAILADKVQPKYAERTSTEMDESLKRVAGAMTTIFRTTSEQIAKKLLGD
jgi:hypothetical protein